MEESAHKGEPNRLINASSPYLQQHAYNPVDWYPWGEEALEKAKNEDKPIIVSIGYSSCHWCHVMERESFENDSIAEIMNEHFISIKVDREERPDVDQIYMDAVQAMGQNGGWPLNVFLTSDQKPFYGGTYFPQQSWAQLLTNIAKAYDNKREEIEKSAEELTNAIATSEVIKFELNPDEKAFDKKILHEAYKSMSKRFDRRRGGFDRAPKFPMPSNWLYLLRYYHMSEDKDALRQLEETLDGIANGGIYDQAGGGFARYSVDADWLVPHFEKMLYDNGQLMSLYSEAYTVTGKELYKEVIYQTTDWLEREMLHEGGFYAALDADSEGEEGKFYVWTIDEVRELLGDDAELIIDYYNITEKGNWEHGKNILHKTKSDEEFAKKHDIILGDLKDKVREADKTFLTERAKRVRPGLDDKILSGWNGLMLKGLADAYEAFQDERFLKLAVNNARFIETKMMEGDKLFRSYKDGKASIAAYLEDYAFVIDGFIALYQITFDEHWLQKAKSMADYTLEHFYDQEEGMFYYTDDSSQKLIARKKEVFDNVIPASNSQMAINLYLLGVIFDDRDYQQKSKEMLSRMSSMLGDQVAYLSNWAILYSYMVTPTAEISIMGSNATEKRNELLQHYYPNKVIMGATDSSDLPLMKSKYAIDNQTTIYVCYNKTCKLPVQEVSEALKQLIK
ncbi:thioredoxin domain-containing protein [Fulvivirga sp. RKSG066]|nr:thioredoxin domain-containing protein [Fulvivirga aurantia]MTI22912.1 thioredoxin domain-containing protein [Fulvivirga aurantia]